MEDLQDYPLTSNGWTGGLPGEHYCPSCSPEERLRKWAREYAAAKSKAWKNKKFLKAISRKKEKHLPLKI